MRSRHRGDESSSLHPLLHEERDGVQHERVDESERWGHASDDREQLHEREFDGAITLHSVHPTEGAGDWRQLLHERGPVESDWFVEAEECGDWGEQFHRTSELLWEQPQSFLLPEGMWESEGVDDWSLFVL